MSDKDSNQKEIHARSPNSQECCYFGRKLTNIICDGIQVSQGSVVIGSDNDDQIYFGECLPDGESMLKERVMMTLIDDESGIYIDVDLEDVLRFSARYCSGLYDRIRSEVIDYEKDKIEL